MKNIEYGIFSFIRNNKLKSFVNVTSSFEYWISTNYFCSKEPIRGGPPNVIINGSYNYAWATLLRSSAANPSIEIDFGSNFIYVSSFSIVTLCSPPNHIVLYGSNDHGSSWNVVGERDQPLSEYSIVNIPCSHPGSYTLFRLQQIGRNTDITIVNYRMHLYKIEFYGMIVNFLKCNTCNQSTIKIITLIHMMIIFFIVFQS